MTFGSPSRHHLSVYNSLTMASQSNIDDVVNQLKSKVDQFSFPQLYKDLNLNEEDFLAVVKKCAREYNLYENNYKRVFISLIEMEYSNKCLISKVFKTLLALNAEYLIYTVLEYIPFKNNSKVFLCQCVAESVWEYQEPGFRLFSFISSCHNPDGHSFLSCILQFYLILTFPRPGSIVRLKHLDNWFRVNADEKLVFYATRLDCLHFKNSVCRNVLTILVAWCLTRGLEVLAMYMRFLCQDFEDVAHFIRNYTPEIDGFITTLGLYPAISNNALNVTLAVFDTFTRNDQIMSLHTRLHFSLFVAAFYTTELQALIEQCQQRGLHKWAMYLMIEVEDWQGMIREAQNCGEPKLVDDVIEKTDRDHDITSLLDFSSKDPEMVTRVLIRAVIYNNMSWVEKIVNGKYKIHKKDIFERWKCVYPFRIVQNTDVDIQDIEAAALEMTQTLNKVYLLADYCSWLEKHYLDQCIITVCRGCSQCEIKCFDEILENNMHRLLKVLLTSGAVPFLTVHQTVQDVEKMQWLRNSSPECASNLLAYRRNCKSLQNLTSLVFSRQIRGSP